VWSWGSNVCGSLGLGNGAPAIFPIPQPVAGITTPNTGTTAPVDGPVHVAGLSGVTQVAAGGTNYSFAVYRQPQGTA
jgi:hypothetical protein